MTAKKITYTAAYTTESGEVITADRTSHRPYTHAAVWQFGDGKVAIASFHSSEALALKASLTSGQKESGVKIIAAVPVTVKGDDAPAETPKAADTVADLSARVDAAHAAADAKKTTKAAPKAKAAKAPKTEATPSTDDIEKAAAELAAEKTEKAQDADADAPTNGHAVVEFFDHLIDTGAMNRATARNHRGIFRSVITGGHNRGLNADVTKINVEAVWDRYLAATPTLLDSTAKVYKQFYLRAIKLFLDYTANPADWTPTGRSEARRARMSHQEFTLADGTTLRVTHTPGTDLKAALETALAALETPAAAEA